MSSIKENESRRKDYESRVRFERTAVWLTFAAVISVLLNLAVPGLPVKVRPFDVIMITVGSALWIFSPRPIRASTALLLTALYFGYAGASAFMLGAGNGFRELIQGCEIVLFAALLDRYRNAIDWNVVANNFLYASALIAAYCILWHVVNGKFSGWKELNEPKFVFLFGPLVLYIVFFIRARAASPTEVIWLSVMLVLLILSGERKALAFSVICIAILLISGRIKAIWVIPIVPVATVAIALAVTTDDYVTRNLDSIWSYLFFEGRTIDHSYKGDGRDIDASLSNSQRMFSAVVSEYLDNQNFWLGIGTNGYFDYVKHYYNDLPEYLTVAIHGQFQTARTEGGVIGLMIYTLPWLRNLGYFLHWTISPVGRTRRRAVVMAIALLGLFIHCRYEGSGLHGALAYVFAIYLPELVGWRPFERPVKAHQPFPSANKIRRPRLEAG